MEHISKHTARISAPISSRRQRVAYPLSDSVNKRSSIHKYLHQKCEKRGKAPPSTPFLGQNSNGDTRFIKAARETEFQIIYLEIAVSQRCILANWAEPKMVEINNALLLTVEITAFSFLHQFSHLIYWKTGNS